MLKQQLPSNVNPMVRPSHIRMGGVARGLDLSDDRGGGAPPAVPFVEMDSATSGWWWTAMAFLMEGFALYGASLYPSATFLVDEASAPATTQQARLAGSDQPAKAHGRGASQPLQGPNVITPELAAWAEQRPRDGGGWMAGLGEQVVGLWTHWRQEQEIRRAVRALAEFDDRTLLDIGIRGRADIERMVRYCRDC